MLMSRDRFTWMQTMFRQQPNNTTTKLLNNRDMIFLIGIILFLIIFVPLIIAFARVGDAVQKSDDQDEPTDYFE